MNTIKKKPGRQKGSVWISQRIVKDLELYPHYRAYVQHRNQAQYRKEVYKLTFEDWIELFGENLNDRGRRQGQWTLRLIDRSQGWIVGNVICKQLVRTTRDTKKSCSINGCSI